MRVIKKMEGLAQNLAVPFQKRLAGQKPRQVLVEKGGLLSRKFLKRMFKSKLKIPLPA